MSIDSDMGHGGCESRAFGGASYWFGGRRIREEREREREGERERNGGESGEDTAIGIIECRLLNSNPSGGVGGIEGWGSG